MRLLTILLLAISIRVANSSDLERGDVINIQALVLKAEVEEQQISFGNHLEQRYCLSGSHSSELPDVLISILSKVNPGIRRKSACVDECSRRHESATNRIRCVFIVVGTPFQLINEEVIVNGSFSAGPLIGGGNSYHLRRKWDAWFIESIEHNFAN